MAKKKDELAKKEKQDVDLATFAGESVKVSVDPEKVGEVVGELVKRATKKVVETVLNRD